MPKSPIRTVPRACGVLRAGGAESRLDSAVYFSRINRRGRRPGARRGERLSLLPIGTRSASQRNLFETFEAVKPILYFYFPRFPKLLSIIVFIHFKLLSA